MCLRCRRARSRRSAVPVAGGGLRRSAEDGRDAVSRKWDRVGDQLPGYDSWELDEQLQHIHRVLQSRQGDCPDFRVGENGTVPLASARPRGSIRRRPVRPLGTSPRRTDPARQRKTAGRRGAVSGGFTWFVLALGTASFACGGVLLGWSLATGRHELWNVGLPVARGGPDRLAGRFGVADRPALARQPRRPPPSSTTSISRSTS